MAIRIIEVTACEGCPWDSCTHIDNVYLYKNVIEDKLGFGVVNTLLPDSSIINQDICLLTGSSTIHMSHSVNRDCPLKDKRDD